MICGLRACVLFSQELLCRRAIGTSYLSICMTPKFTTMGPVIDTEEPQKVDIDSIHPISRSHGFYQMLCRTIIVRLLGLLVFENIGNIITSTQ